MSHTNSTTNYSLPQFVGTDKPAWLTDINGAFSTIDTNLKTVSDNATTAGTNATTANTSIGTLSNLNTTTKTDLVSAINEVNTAAGTAQYSADEAQTKANQAKNGVDDISDFININSYTNYNTISDFVRTSGAGSVTSASVTVAKNSDGSLCKIYGEFNISGVNEGSTTIKLNRDTGLHPTSRLTIGGCGITTAIGKGTTGLTIYINTDGTLEFNAWTLGGAVNTMRPLGCLIYVKDFGDTPTENA